MILVTSLHVGSVAIQLIVAFEVAIVNVVRALPTTKLVGTLPHHGCEVASLRAFASRERWAIIDFIVPIPADILDGRLPLCNVLSSRSIGRSIIVAAAVLETMISHTLPCSPSNILIPLKIINTMLPPEVVHALQPFILIIIHLLSHLRVCSPKGNNIQSLAS